MTQAGWLDSVLVAIHVPAGILATLVGLGAMLATPKGGPTHLRRGRSYVWALLVVAATGLGLVATRGPGFAHLAALGVLAAALGLTGYFAREKASSATHVVCMSFSYVAMLTAFYVDNGPRLPGWRLLPEISFWVLPSLVGAPLVALALRRNARGRRTRTSGR